MKEFLTFQRFNDKILAEELMTILKEKNIEYEVEDNFSDYDHVTFVKNELNNEVCVKLMKEDFDEAHDILINRSTIDIEKVERAYYLFKFTDEELIEIVSKPDEWGYIDYCLSLKILKERGKEINPDLARVLRKNRVKELSKTETGAKVWIIFGYASALLGGIIGLFMGIHIATYKKVLPNGDKVYSFEESDRKHGVAIVVFGIIGLIFLVIMRIMPELK